MVILGHSNPFYKDIFIFILSPSIYLIFSTFTLLYLSLPLSPPSITLITPIPPPPTLNPPPLFMLSYYGITELVGDSGSGKTAIAIEESKKFKTLYLTSTNFPIERYNFNQNQYENVFIEVIQSISDLLFVLNFKFKVFNFFELIVIDSLYQIVFIEKRSTREITNLIYILKKMLKMYKNLRILILNTCCLKTIRSNRVSFISKLGLNWEYHVNTKYKCQKEGEDYKIEMVKSPMNQELKMKFRIKRDEIEIV